MRRLLPALVVLALAVLPARAATTDVSVSGNAYTPSGTTVASGDTVRWTNKDDVPHTVTADDNSFRLALAPDATMSQPFPTAGYFPYHCEIHAPMHGSVLVQGAQATTTSQRSTTTASQRTTTTLEPRQSGVTAPGETTTTARDGTTTTVTEEATTTSTTPDDDEEGAEEAAPAEHDGGDDTDGEPSNAGPAAVAALLLAAVSGSAALAVRKGL